MGAAELMLLFPELFGLRKKEEEFPVYKEPKKEYKYDDSNCTSKLNHVSRSYVENRYYSTCTSYIERDYFTNTRIE